MASPIAHSDSLIGDFLSAVQLFDVYDTGRRKAHMLMASKRCYLQVPKPLAFGIKGRITRQCYSGEDIRVWECALV